MIFGHGDDGFKYREIRYNFSSNIYQHADLSELERHLCRHISDIRHYPEPEPVSLEKELADTLRIPEQCVLVTNGATEAIYLIANTLRQCGYEYFRHEKPTFSEYGDASRRYGLKWTDNEDGKTIFWLCNPNNPTGTAYDKHTVLQMARIYGMLVVDQSYEIFTKEPPLLPYECIGKKKIVQIHSLTKRYAIPGLRLGFIVAAQDIIDKIKCNALPWSVNSLAIRAASFLLNNDVKAVGDIDAYLAETQRLRANLDHIDGIKTLPTATNFMLVRVEGLTAAELKDRLAIRHKILIRDASNFEGLDEHWFRVAAQTREENDLLVEAIRDCLIG